MDKAAPLIAVVDDTPAVCKALQRLLRSANFEVSAFNSGVSFLASLGGRRPDCVVLDLFMPGVSGLDVQSSLSADPKGVIPVIIITAQDSPAIQAAAMAGGAAAYLRKPVDAQVLLVAIRTAIARNAA